MPFFLKKKQHFYYLKIIYSIKLTRIMFLDLFSNFSFILLQVQSEVDFIGQLYKLSPIIGLLLIGIGFLIYLLKKRDDKLNEKEEEIKELNKYIRENDSENIKILEKVSLTLDRVMEQDKTGNSAVLKEIDNLKQLILLKIGR